MTTLPRACGPAGAAAAHGAARGQVDPGLEAGLQGLSGAGGDPPAALRECSSAACSGIAWWSSRRTQSARFVCARSTRRPRQCRANLASSARPQTNQAAGSSRPRAAPEDRRARRAGRPAGGRHPARGAPEAGTELRLERSSRWRKTILLARLPVSSVTRRGSARSGLGEARERCDAEPPRPSHVAESAGRSPA